MQVIELLGSWSKSHAGSGCFGAASAREDSMLFVCDGTLFLQKQVGHVIVVAAKVT